MQTTLSERLKEAMAGPPKVTGKALAQACGVKPPSVSDWLTGKTKTIEGSNLIAAAERLRVRPKWLADGTGPMRDPTYSGGPVSARDSDAVAYMTPTKDPLECKMLTLFHELDPDGKRELLTAIEFFVAGRRPHQDGHTSVLAG